MEIKQVLYNLMHYYTRTRAVGHTHLMLNGTKNRDMPFKVLVSSLRHGKMLEFEDFEILTPESFEDRKYLELLGIRTPLVIDNYAIEIILTSAFNRIQELEKTVSKLQKGDSPNE